MDEGLISWNFPNIVSIFIMIFCLWGITGLISHFTRKSSNSNVVHFGAGGSQAATGNAPGVSYGMNFQVAA